MTTTLDRLTELLKAAESSALMENAGFGFPNDRIEIKSVHFGDDRTGRVGDVLHPTDYIKRITDLYRHSWILGPLREAIQLIEANQEMLRRCDALREYLDRSGIQELRDLARAGLKD